MPGRLTQRLQNLLPRSELEEARWLLGYPAESVGRLMTPDYVAVRPEWTIAQALDEHIRRLSHDSETINHIFVVDDDWHLVDDIELRPFLLSRLRLDPATASAPLVTSLADITGVLVYFSIASWYLRG